MHRKLRRAGGFAAIAAPILMWSGFFIAALSRPGYNLLTRPFSDLATRGSVNAIPFDIAFFLIPGGLAVVVGFGLWFAGNANRAWRVGATLIVGAGVLLFATGVFQQDPTLDAASILHRTVSQFCFAVASVAPVILFIAARQDARIDAPRRVWLVTGVAAAAMEVVALALIPIVHYPDGLFQRPFTIALTAWFVATGAWLLRMRGGEGLVVAE
ncbi:MAG TPA: DUF998 domain-containing protein [Candidatus Dormibacteraeota bacterium]|nr:DUF998 domain-containing protein [Candidatus Dormibacteraeota bacterium]